MTTFSSSVRQGPTDSLLNELLQALANADPASLALSLPDEIAAKAIRKSLRQLVRDRLDELIPLATEPVAGLICYLLGVTSERIAVNGRVKWTLHLPSGDAHTEHYATAAEASQAAVLMRFPRKAWELEVDRGVVRTRYWAWALVQALDSMGEAGLQTEEVFVGFSE